MPFRPIVPTRLLSQVATAPLVVVRARVRPAAGPAQIPQSKRRHHITNRSGPNWDEHGEYIVGRGRPPVKTRWQKDQSGNPRGPKPKEPKDDIMALHKEVLADFTTRVNGEEVQLNVPKFVVQLMKAAAAKGVVKAQLALLELYRAAVRHQAEGKTSPEIEAWEQSLIDSVLEQYNLNAAPVVRAQRRAANHSGDSA